MNHTDWLRSRALELGFGAVGIAKAEELTEEARRLERWLSGGNHASMQYMENHFEQRIDPRRLVEGARTVVSLLFNYYNPEPALAPDAPKLALYAYGKDYHEVLKKKLRLLLDELRQRAGDINGRCFVDSAPVLERQWAQRAGLGWTGKNTLLLSKGRGSYFFLAELIIDLELQPDPPFRTDHCGTCRRCIEVCPTQALSPEGYVLDAGRCISYLTIELKEAIPEAFRGKMDDWMFGCDLCQQVCPWNRFALPHTEPDFMPNPELARLSRRDWEELTEETFGRVFSKSAVKRAKHAGLLRNIRFLRQERG